MSEFKATKSQSDAILTRNRAVLVSAAAGSGKTKVLTERLLKRITDEVSPADVDSFLIITFTKAAAAELRSRIMDEIALRLAEEPDNRRLRRQSALCQRAQIGTIHSFCGNLLRENCHAAGLSPEFKVIEEDRSEAIKANVIEKVMESKYEKIDGDFRLLADTLGQGRDDAALVKLVLNLHKKMQSHAEPEKWAEMQIEALNRDYSDVSETPWGREIIENLRLRADFWAHKLEELCLEMQGEEKILKAYGDSVAETAAQLREFSKTLDKGWDAARERLPIEFPKMVLRNSPNPELSERVKEIRKTCKKECCENSDCFNNVMSSDSEKLLADMKKTAPAMGALLKLTLEFDRAYAAEKRRRAEVDFSDLEHMSYRLLSQNEEIAESVSRKFTEIMVDEYQDVNAVQDAIFRAVSRNGENLFMVGDVKQSIYRFRLADPTIFTEKYNSFADLDAAEEKAPVRIMLQENFRSRAQVLTAANHVFRTCMSEALGDIAYDGNAELKCGAAYEGSVPVPELMLLALPKSEDGDAPDKTEQEAVMVAEKIKSLIDSGTLVTDRGLRRPARYSDVAILMRSANSAGDVYRRVLIEAGVPVMNGQGGAFFGSVEISGFISLLAVIDNPHQDVPLISALRWPAFGFSADELSEIRAADKNADFYTALLKRSETDGKCADFIEKLNRFREYAGDMELGELIWKLYNEVDAFAVFAAMRDGDNRCGNLRLMSDYAKRFEATGFRGLHRFVEWLGKLYERGEEPSRGSSGNAVQIMTVHKSKGLEFPIVFLCDTARQFNTQDLKESVLVHPKLGLGPKVTDTERGISYYGIARNAIRMRSKREMLSEEMRLLYVALTRAREYLFMTAALKNPEKELQKLMLFAESPMSPEMLMKAVNPVTWLMYAVLTDKNDCMRLSIQYDEDAEKQAQEQGEKIRTEADGGIKEKLRRNLSFRYAHTDAEALPSKVTATEMKSYDEPDAEAVSVAPHGRSSFRTPDFLRESRPMTGTEKGTATHTVLQFMDYEKADSLESIQAEIERLRACRFISDRQAEAVDAKAILKLFSSEIGQRIMNADSLNREFKFSILCPAEDFFNVGKGEKVLLQGIMDCCIEEKGEITVIDYKTDRVKGDALLSRAETYKGQLRAYAIAAQRITGKPVKECVLYFLNAGEAVSVMLNDKC